MTVQRLIAALQKCKHKKTSKVLFEHWSGSQQLGDFELESIGQFGVVTDVVFHLKPTWITGKP